MTRLVHQRCFNHSLREAAARCPECGRCFCRECITEHDDRVICAACLRKVARPPFTQRTGFLTAVRSLQVIAGVITLWVFFYFLGHMVESIPDAFHEGALWKESWDDEPAGNER